MAERPIPEWFKLGDTATTETMKRLSIALQELKLPIQIRHLPMQAHWFILDSLALANQANRDGMHANALALTRQCVEAMSIIELGLSGSTDGIAKLKQWEQQKDNASPGNLRKWLSENRWHLYGTGLWSEPWNDFMAMFAKAIQPYAHYTAQLAQWQARLIGGKEPREAETFIVQFAPRAYDPQKATRITLFHALLTFALAKAWIASSTNPDSKFVALTNRFRLALGRSKYLDGHQTNWDQQFWAMVWSKGGKTILE